MQTELSILTKQSALLIHAKPTDITASLYFENTSAQTRIRAHTNKTTTTESGNGRNVVKAYSTYRLF